MPGLAGIVTPLSTKLGKYRNQTFDRVADVSMTSLDTLIVNPLELHVLAIPCFQSSYSIVLDTFQKMIGFFARKKSSDSSDRPIGYCCGYLINNERIYNIFHGEYLTVMWAMILV